MNTNKASLTTPAEVPSAEGQRGQNVKSYSIDKNIPIPAPLRSPGRPSDYPFDSMQPGDSFLAQAETKADFVRVRNAANSYGSRKGKAFTTRKVDGGVRVWCVKAEAV